MARRSERLDPVTADLPDLADDEVVGIVKTSAGAMFLPARVARRYDDETLALLATMQQTVTAIEAHQDALSDHVHQAREWGVSWDTIAMMVGMTARGASFRWGAGEREEG